MRINLFSWQAAGIIAIAVAAVAMGQDRKQGRKDAPPPRSEAGAPQRPEPPRGARADTPEDRVDQILTRLEATHITALDTKVSWKMRYITDDENDATIKEGQLFYLDVAPVPRFLVKFTTVTRDNRTRSIDERHLFDGRYYVRLDSTAGEGKGIVDRREIRRENDPNPFRVDEGQFPMPFGQRKADVLKEYSVKLEPPGKGDPALTDHLLLTPRPGSNASKTYGEVHMWVGQEQNQYAGMPVRVRTFRKDPTGRTNSQVTVDFQAPHFDTPLRPGMFVILTPPGYAEQVERLEDVPAPAGAREPG